MSANTELCRATVEAFNNRDWGRLTSLLAPNCVYDEVSTGRRRKGHAEILETEREWANAFEDVQGTITSSLEQGEAVVMEITWKGTHSGPMAGPLGSIPPSRKSATTRAVQLFRCSDGKVVEVRHYFDLYALLRQIGAVPAGEARTARA